MHPIRTIRSYIQAIPPIVTLQSLSAIALAALYVLAKHLAVWALRSQGRVAVTTGDLAFLYTTWQGALLLVLALVALYLVVGLDLGVKLAFAGRWVRGEDVDLKSLLLDALQALRRLLCPTGVLVALYIALLVPLVGVGFSLLLTESLKIPTFISSVFDAVPLSRIAYYALVFVFSLVGFFGLFAMHGVVIDQLSVRDSLRQSFDIVRDNWLDYLLSMLLFSVLNTLVMTLVGAALAAGGVALASVLVGKLGAAVGLSTPIDTARFLALLATLLTMVVLTYTVLVIASFMLIKMTKLYLEYTTDEPVDVPKRPHRLPLLQVLGAFALLAAVVVGALLMTRSFDTIFPAVSEVGVVAHRACGDEGPENSVMGIDKAVEVGVWGAQIDIQRTADGAYVVSHDTTFERVAGDSRKPSEMTLEEVRQLTVKANPADPSEPGQPVATYEEMLDASRGRVVLLVEFTGETADRQMADDAVRIARERGMLDQCIFVSLQYDIIDYLENSYPNVQTGLLAFDGFGDTAALDCDYLGLKELAATSDTVDATHQQGKKVLVWTVDDAESQRRFLCSHVDAIITDNMTQAEEVRTELAGRGDYDRIVDVLLSAL